MPRELTEEFVQGYLKNAVTAQLGYVHPDAFLEFYKSYPVDEDLEKEDLLLEIHGLAMDLIGMEWDRLSPDQEKRQVFWSRAPQMTICLMELCRKLDVENFRLAQKPTAANRKVYLSRIFGLSFDLIMMSFEFDLVNVKLRASTGTIVQLLTLLGQKYYASKEVSQRPTVRERPAPDRSDDTVDQVDSTFYEAFVKALQQRSLPVSISSISVVEGMDSDTQESFGQS